MKRDIEEHDIEEHRKLHAEVVSKALEAARFSIEYLYDVLGDIADGKQEVYRNDDGKIKVRELNKISSLDKQKIIDLIQKSVGLISSARLCTINSMSNRNEQLRLMGEAKEVLETAYRDLTLGNNHDDGSGYNFFKYIPKS